MASHPIPEDQVWWDSFSALRDRNEALLRSIAEQSMAADPKRDSTHQKIGDYYAACMDEASADAAGSKPTEAELQRIAAINSRTDLAAELGHLHRMLYLLVQGSIFPSLTDPGSKEPLFGFYSYQDATKVVAFVDQGGLGLPDRDYYLRDDKDSVELRQK
jgi:endothelin-converting enzyme/putative endopeptidase